MFTDTETPNLTTPVKCVVVRATDQHATISHLAVNMVETLQEVVGGCFEAIRLALPNNETVTVYLDEDGQRKELPVNRLAGHLLAFISGQALAGPLVGDVVIVGDHVTDEDIMAGDVPDELLAMIEMAGVSLHTESERTGE